MERPLPVVLSLLLAAMILSLPGAAIASAQAPDVGGGTCVANCGGGKGNSVGNPYAAAAAAEAERQRQEAQRKAREEELRRQEEERRKREAEERQRQQEEFERSKAQTLHDLKGISGEPGLKSTDTGDSGLKDVGDTGLGLKNPTDAVSSPPATGDLPASTHPAPPHTRIGAAAAVRGTVYWLTSDGRKVPITAGGPVYSNARIVTGDNSRLQLLLLDETVFTMGANSDIVLDDFVYDTDPSAHTIMANVRMGIFRFVTGKAARHDPAKMKVTLPVGTIGIRGTDFEATINPDGSGSVVLHSGQLEVTEKKTGSSFLINAGEKVTFTAEGDFSRPVKFQ